MMCNWRASPRIAVRGSTAVGVLVAIGLAKRSDHGGMNHLSGDQIIDCYLSERQEFVDELSLTAFAMARHPAHAHPASCLVSRRGGKREPLPRGAPAFTGSAPRGSSPRAGSSQASQAKAKPNWETPRRSRCVNLVASSLWVTPRLLLGAALSIRVGKFPIELARAAEERARLQVAPVDAPDRGDLTVIADDEDLVRLVDID